jgi:hypothetical protein
MKLSRARSFAVVYVLGATLTCVGCYKPAAGSSSQGTPTVTPPPMMAVSPTASGSGPQPSTTAAPTATPTSTQLASAVDAALRNPVPSGTVRDRFMRPMPTPSGTQPLASRSPSRSPRTKVLAAPQAGGGVLGITFDDVIFPLEPNQSFDPSLLTDSVRALFGRKIKIRGYIHPSCPFQTGVTSFILVRDDQSCCFGPGAALYDCIIVDMVPGRTTNFTPKPVAVEGTFTLREFKDLNGKYLAIYHLDGEAVE